MPSIARLIGYAQAPKATYMVRHPVRGTKALIAAKGAKGLVTTRAGAALGGLMALPLGVMAFMRRSKGSTGKEGGEGKRSEEGEAGGLG